MPFCPLRTTRPARSMPRKTEDITSAKEMTAQGRWIWTLSGSSGEGERTREDVGRPGS
jgi:hypothetical protein